jgi:uncharacterized YccA/Bax inhibitor family protein
MTAGGAAGAALLLTALLLVAGFVGWMAVPTAADGSLILPGWTIGAALLGFVLAIAMLFKVSLARFLAPVYAIAEGVFLGAIFRAFEARYDGIVPQAVGATMGVFVVMLVLYRSGVIRVSARMRRIVMGATLGIVLFYGVALLASLFGARAPRSLRARARSGSCSASWSPASRPPTSRWTSTSSSRVSGRASPSTWSGSLRSGCS